MKNVAVFAQRQSTLCNTIYCRRLVSGKLSTRVRNYGNLRPTAPLRSRLCYERLTQSRDREGAVVSGHEKRSCICATSVNFVQHNLLQAARQCKTKYTCSKFR